MPLPSSVRVKLSSEVAESISITPVVVRDIPVRELIEHMIGITGKDEARVHELLLRGTLVSGASRFRWAGWDADPEAIRETLASFPDPDPGRRFAAESGREGKVSNCVERHSASLVWARSDEGSRILGVR